MMSSFRQLSIGPCASEQHQMSTAAAAAAAGSGGQLVSVF